MKKWVCLLLALVMVFSFTACDNDDSSKRDDSDAAETDLYASTVTFSVDITNVVENSNAYYNAVNLANGQLTTCVELMKTQEYYELIAEKAGRNLTADDVQEMLGFKVTDDPVLKVTVTHEAPIKLQAVRKAVLDETPSYISDCNADITLTAQGVSEVEKVDN